MRPVLVTGASGFIGWHVARLLLDRGWNVRLLAREQSVIRELDGAEPIRGDLRDPGSVERAVSGCGAVFHVAADYRLWTRKPAEMYRTNVEGTRHVLDACRKHGVDRVVYTSTVGCIGLPEGGVGDENTPVALKDMTGHYKRSKFLAEQLVLKEAAGGLPVVIVNPTAPVGDHDWKPTPTGRIVLDYLRRRMPAYLDTGLNVVDVRDVALGHLLAYERGNSGERYILGGENLTLAGIFERLAAISRFPAPEVRIPYAIAYAFGCLSTGWAHLTGREPRVPLEGVRMARKRMWVSSDKAKKSLGYRPAAAEAGLRRAVEWFRVNGYVRV